MATIDGTSASENLNGGSGDDVILAGGGNDVVSGGSGADSIDGGTGADRLAGGSGADTLDGGSGADTVSGDSGDDTLIYNTTTLGLGGAAAGKDVYDGGSGYDTLRLLLNSTTWTAAQSQLASFNSFLTANTLPNGDANNASFVFTFGGYQLDASKFEKLVINLNGSDIGAITSGDDGPVVAAPLASTATEDGPAASVDAFANAWDAEGSTLMVTGLGGLPAGVTYNSGTHTFSLDPSHAAYQDLALGQTRTVTVNYGVTDGANVTSTSVSWTITGSNDVPTITSGSQTGAVTEDADTTSSASDSLSASGTVAFTDVDLSDTHTAAFAASGSNTTILGTFALGSVSEAANAANGSVGWTYTLNNGAAQYLAAGQSVTETYVVTVDDGHGGAVDEIVTVTVTGTNDDPTITSGAQTGAVTEDDTAPITATGTITFSDVDLADGHTASFAADAANPNLGTFQLAPVSEAPDAAPGSVGWTYTLDNGAAQHLAAGQQATESFVVTIDDGQGGEVDATVTVTVTGTNDDPTITSGAQAGAVTEDGAAPMTATGAISFSDVDLADGHTASFAADAGNPNLGTFQLAPVSEAPGAATGSVGWTYTLNNGAAQYLAAGQQVTESFVVTVDDGEGGEVDETVTVSVTGANDDPTITSGAQAGTVTEDAATTPSATDLQSAAGAVTFTDVDLSDAHSASFTAGGSNTTSLGTFVLGSVSEAPGAANGSVGWTYTLDNAAAQSLGAGDSVIENYVVTVDDGHGGTAQQTVAVTITGTNDAPTSTPVTLAPIAEDSGARVITQAELLANAEDIDGDTLTATGLMISSGGGSLTDNLNGTWTYLAAANDDTSVSFSYSVSDGALSASGSASLDITAVNDAPVNTKPGSQTVNEDAPISITGLSVSDVDAGAVSITTTLSVTQGTLIVNSAGGAAVSGSGTMTVTLTGSQSQINTTLSASNNVVYQGSANYNGSDTLTIDTNDGGATGAGGALGDTDTVSIAVNAVNDPAVIGGTSAGAVTEAGASGPGVPSAGGTLTITDVDSPATFQAASGSSASGYGTYSVNAGGAWSYNLDNGDATVDALNDGQSLSDSFTVLSQDGTAKVVTITINGDTDGGQTLTGNSFPNTLTGGAGNDLIDGRQDADSISGGDGDDTLIGGDVGDAGTGRDTLSGGPGNDSLSGGNGNDVLDGGTGNDTLTGSNDNDSLTGGDGDDAVDGGSANDALDGGAGADSLTGGDGNDTITGSTENDTLTGGNGGDSLVGNDGTDNLSGDAGNDTLSGGLGNDTLAGGANSDTFAYSSTAEAPDTITGFASGTDKIDLSAIDGNTNVSNHQDLLYGGQSATVVANSVSWSSSGGNTTVRVDTDGNTSSAEMVITVTGAPTLTSNDFIL